MKETGQVNVPVGNVLLKLAVDEIDNFAEMIDDITIILSSNMKLTVHTCQSCGTKIQEIDYEEPEGEDLH